MRDMRSYKGELLWRTAILKTDIRGKEMSFLFRTARLTNPLLG